MQVIEAQYSQVLAPHDHLHIKHRSLDMTLRYANPRELHQMGAFSLVA